MPRVFISHSTRDRDDVERRIVGPLREGGIDTWYSRDDIQTGAMWDQTIREGLESCDWFLLVMSPRSEESEWVRHELFWAMQHRPNRIIPVRIADCDPWRFHMALPRIQQIDFLADPDEGCRKLLTKFGGGCPAAPPEPPPAGTATARVHVSRILERNTLAIPPQGRVSHALVKLLPTGSPARVASDVVFVVDVSSRMLREDGTGSSRLRRVRGGLMRAIAMMHAEDRVALVAYAFDAATLLPATPVGNAGQQIKQALAELETCDVDSGGNALDLGLRLGLRECHDLGRTDRHRQLVALINDETSGEAACRELAAEMWRTKVRLNLIGVGTDWNQALIKDLARLAEGNWGYLDVNDREAANKVLTDPFCGIQIPPFSNTELHVRPRRGVEVRRAMRVAPDVEALLMAVRGAEFAVPLGTLEREREVACLVELYVPHRLDGRYVLADLEVTFDTEAGRLTSGVTPIEVTISAAGDGPANSEPARYIGLLPSQAEVLCPNLACGVVNPPGERTCLRCATPIPFPAGTLLHGRYQIQKHIGTGGFGAVYLAADTRTGADVAVKEMLCSDPQEFAIRLNFFRREAEVLRQLHRLDITARFFDLIEEGKAAHLVMEFVRGRDLLARMEANGNRPFAFGQVVEWGKAVCDLMTAAHTQDPPLILRQMKPDDMILLEDLRSIKFVDFGTARDLGGTPEERLKSKTRVYVEGYAPPEQIIGKPEPRSDLFALAATLFHLITGKAPEGVHTAEEVEAMLAGGAIRTEQRWLYELIRINLSEDIGDRYHTAREIKRDLEMRQVTRKVRCGGCKHVNEVRTPFCAGCERPLTEMSAMPCPGCLAYYRLGSRRCASCSAAVR